MPSAPPEVAIALLFLALPLHTASALDESGNGLSDVFESHYGLAGTVDAGSDDDGDGLSLLQEFRLGSDPRVADGWSVVEPSFGLSGDGLEALLGFRPRAGLRYEIQSNSGLDAAGWQSEEVVSGDDAPHALSYPATAPQMFFRFAALGPAPDADGDQLDSREEALLGTPPDQADQDHDSLDDAGEFRAGSDANDPDSDDDGTPDGFEVRRAGTSPTTPDSPALNPLPFTENFESYPAGPLGGQGGWIADGASTRALVQTGIARGGLKAVYFTAGGHLTR